MTRPQGLPEVGRRACRRFLHARPRTAAALSGSAPAAPKSVDKGIVDSWLASAWTAASPSTPARWTSAPAPRRRSPRWRRRNWTSPSTRSTMVMGDTATTPDQWVTGGQPHVMRGGVELRKAAATARQALLLRAGQRARRAGRPAHRRRWRGARRPAIRRRSVAYADLIGSDGFKMAVDTNAPVKKPAEYTVVGKSIAARGHPGEGHGRVHLRSRFPPAGHAARPRDSATRRPAPARFLR